MALSKYKLGELIELTTETNACHQFGANDVRGMTITKQISPTKANVSTADLSKFLVIHPKEFLFNPRTHGKHIGFGYNNTNDSFIISWNNIGFRIKSKMNSTVLAEYLFIHFNRDEWDREACYRSWGSSTEVFSWDALCEMELALPDLPTQQKYVDIYNAMVANQQAYERGLEDLKLTCDAYIEDLRRKMSCEKIGLYIVEENNRNKVLQNVNVKGVNSSGSFDETRANTNGLDFSSYKIVSQNQFAYNPSRINLGSIALYKDELDCIISPMYCVFSIRDTEKLLPEYLMLWFGRKEFQRSTLFFAIGSVRDTFDYSLMQETSIPIPGIKMQRVIAEMYTVYNKRKEINEQLKTQIKNICPILIKGSLEEN